MHKQILAALLVALAPTTTMAADGNDDGWSGNGELGLAVSKGNTDSQTLVGKLNLAKEGPVWSHGAGLSILYGKSDGLESAYRYEFFGDTRYKLGERSELFGSLRSERDHFSANEYQTTIAAGYAFQAIDSKATGLRFEVGPGYRWSKLQDVRVHKNEAILRGAMDFKHQLTETTSLYDKLLVEAGSSNTFARNEAGVQVKMSDAFALKAGVEVRHNTDVPVGIKKTDTLTTVNVVYGF